MKEKMRLDKFLSDMLSETRKEVKSYIKKGRIKVNENKKPASDEKIDLENDKVYFDGRLISYTKFFYYMMNKPPEVITSTEKGRTKTVMDVLLENGLSCPFFEQLSPVGRLDKDTVGLLFITNDGELNHRLLSPKNHVPKTYFARLDKEADDGDILSFKEGLDLGDFFTKPAQLEILDDRTHVKVTITEGKFHQVKRMFEKVGKNVIFLKRLTMGSLTLDEALSLGEFRELTPFEVSRLKQECKL